MAVFKRKKQPGMGTKIMLAGLNAARINVKPIDKLWQMIKNWLSLLVMFGPEVSGEV